MIESLTFFPSQCALNSGPVIDAVITSARRHGIRVVDNSWDADAALIWSVLWSGRMRENQLVYDHYRRQGRPVVIAEVGALVRNITWKLAIDNVNALGYYGHERDLDPDRPRRLGLSIMPRTSPADHVLIACQNNRSLQMQTVGDQATWVYRTVQEIRRFSDRPIRVRPHPRSPLDLRFSQQDVRVEIPRKVPHTYDDYDLDFNCHTVININSSPGLLAPMHSTPVIVDQSSLAWPISISIPDIEQPPGRDLDQWLIEISHTEYLLEEITQGSWLKRLGHRL